VEGAFELMISVYYKENEPVEECWMRAREFRRAAAALVVLSAFHLAGADNRAIYEEQIAPIFALQCASCHSGTAPKADFAVGSFDAVSKGGKHGRALIPGSSRDSLVMQYLRGERNPKMPLGGQLPPDAIEKIAKAIDAMQRSGEARPASDAHLEWLLKAPEEPKVPAVKTAGWIRNPIDAFVMAKLEAKGMTPAPPASCRVLLRRLYFDLVGVPPAPEEARQFLNDPDPNAYEKLVDRLLADPRYGERYARHWLDLARYAESDGFAVDWERPTAWRYRDYVIRAFNQDKPYDLFVKEQLAGDELRDKRLKEEDKSERLVALGFLRMATWEADATSKKQLRQDFLNEVTATTGSVFLGMTVGCAQCHNHKYDPIPQRDFYRLQAFFAATGIEELPAPFINAERPADMKRLLRQYEDELETAKEELENRKEELKQRFIALKEIKPDDPAVGEFLKELGVANAFFQEREDKIFQQPEWQRYSETKDRVQKLTELMRRYKPVAYAVKDLTPPNVPELPATHILQAGELDAKGQVVEPGFPECVAGSSDPAKIPFSGDSSGRRLALAEWIASAGHPLTARVIANRVWQWHFGDGLVRTPSDFGKNGARPEHPELLDWLSRRLVDEKWSLKALHRMILTSNTYRQAVEHPAGKQQAEIDPNNELLWHMNWLRMDAEVLRDTLLMLSGRLNPESGGPGALLDVPPDVAEGFEFFKWFPSEGREQSRRTIYTFQRRSVVDPMMETFDVASIAASCARRNTTTVAPQALTLMNGGLPNSAAKQFAARLVEMAGPDVDRQVEHAFWAALSRAPSDAERRKARAMAAAPDGLNQLALVLFNLNEFLYVE
jgi:hypothetical protein